ncbi:hypothetical protein JTB14_033639 [Gonioctena quinquepunctata]|nr:hypothetical protein JTB14_033639 [Gonioctena quinquepunctata]
MKSFIVASFCLAVVASLPLGIYEDNSDGEYYVVPLERMRSPDLKGVIKHEGTLLSGDNYHLDGSAYAAKDLPISKVSQARTSWRRLTKHDNGLSAVLGADHLRGDPRKQSWLNYDIYHDKNFNVDLDANYRRQFGGPLGAGKPDAGVFLTATGRDTTYDIQGPDLKGVIKHEGTILSGDNYHLDGSAYAAKDLTDLKGLHKPELLGGDFRLKHDNGLSAVLGADHLRGGPTDVKAGVNYDIYHDKNFNVDLDANYRRQFGGPFGAGKPDAGVFLTATGRW